jgi:hypothetical protein
VGDYLGIFDGLMARLHGPMAFRFLMQPLMAIVLAVRDGRRDARAGRPPFAWALLTGARERRGLLLSAWQSVGSVMIVAALVDSVFQLMVFGGFRPGAGMLAALFLAALPYSLLRGPVNRGFSRRAQSLRGRQAARR